MIVQQQEADLLAPLMRFQHVTQLALLVGMLVLLVLVWITLGRALRPIRVLTNTATAIANSKLEQVPLFKGSDEVGQLACAFQSMTMQLQALIQNLEQRIVEREHAEEALRESQRRLADIIDFSPDAMLVIDTEGRVIAWNRAMEMLTDVAAEDMLGQGDYAYALPFYGERRPVLVDMVLIPVPAYEASYDLFVRYEPHRLVAETAITMVSGRSLYVHTIAVALYNARGEIAGAIEILRDITEQKRVEAALRQHRQNLETLVHERTSELSSANERLSQMNGALYQEMFERQRMHEALRTANHQLLRKVHELEWFNQSVAALNQLSSQLFACNHWEEMQQVIERQCQQIFAEESGVLYLNHPDQPLLEACMHWGNGTISPTMAVPDCWSIQRNQHCVGFHGLSQTCCEQPNLQAALSVCVPLHAEGNTLGLFHVQSTSVESTRSLAMQQMAYAVGDLIAVALANLNLRETLRQQSIRDPLTNLFNRRYLEEIVLHEFERAEQYGQLVSLLLLDMDHFKAINDTFGHDIGDCVLCRLAELLQTQTRSHGIVCRYGGEEFLIVLPDTSLVQAYTEAEALRMAFHQIDFACYDKRLQTLSFSAGVAAFPTHGTSADAVIQAADVALYQAKKLGRNCVVIADKVIQ
ncbi:MAG: diguanylate cyclase [Chloroflexaceae bacterium]|nr:diguanylate cyclase [Chloroflexaceae bacterium]